jgi:tRNA threonylcarbamoyladenosine biosynthesis protein TsaB
MARGLAIETSGKVGSVALVEDGNVIGEDCFEHGLRHAAEMVPRIDQLVRARQWTPSDLREIYVSIGPGSFTGLRIGITLAKTLAFATGAAIAAVPSLQVLARNAPPDARHVIIVLDAKRDQIFTARFSRSLEQEAWTIDEPAHLDSLANMLLRGPRPLHLIGEGIPYHSKYLDTNDASVIVTPPELWRARAAVVAEIGHAMLRAGQSTDPQRLLPLYIRKPEAEETAEKARG